MIRKTPLFIRISFITLFLLPHILCAQYEPAVQGQLIRHTYYCLDYNENHKQANWVYYMLTYDLINGDASRADDFRPDPNVKQNSVTLEDYKGSGYDRGHLCPAADMKHSR